MCIVKISWIYRLYSIENKIPHSHRMHLWYTWCSWIAINAKMQCMFSWNYVYFSINSTPHRTALHCIHLRKVHRCVQCAMCNSPVTWMCQLFVATAFYPSILIILWLGWQVPRNRFVLFNWSRESLVGGKRLPLSVNASIFCLNVMELGHFMWICYCIGLEFALALYQTQCVELWNVYWWYAQNESTHHILLLHV